MSLSASFSRKSSETDVSVSLQMTSEPARSISTTVPFFDHMLEALALHGGLGIELKAAGDTEVDIHHLVEDCGIALGNAVRELQGSAGAIERAGFFIFPMDGSRARVVLDLCGRSHLVWNGELRGDHSTPFSLWVFREFFAGFSQGGRATLHIDLELIDNDHHAIEACFKAFGKALRAALAPNAAGLMPSTKGVIDD